ncbi:hypothetical protein FOCG_01910 [Fusarium oxysporum f. sp. radicis-lycopersici 26381]|nr:hypothetical protein FOWG_00103 [Fusarium oxysporum f. sp. lycopersici MN25]EXL58369.1 hypothetical protein FOCG_01910 [Fusarium oxysporum f. sp. radicis-lycopersici 26381]KAJ4282782.1 hypothetical protein NW764_003793 [Fusarium oxysporum]
MSHEITEAGKLSPSQPEYHRGAIPPVMQNWLDQPKRAEPWSPVHVQTQPTKPREAELPKL